jgi:hypothetical protein
MDYFRLVYACALYMILAMIAVVSLCLVWWGGRNLMDALHHLLGQELHYSISDKGLEHSWGYKREERRKELVDDRAD